MTVSLQLHSDSPTSHPEIKDANQVLMASRYALKNPHKIGEDRARFTGNQMSATLFCYCFKYLFEIKIYKVLGMQQNLVSVVVVIIDLVHNAMAIFPNFFSPVL